MRTAIYPGSFDPITNGHIDVLERALDIFDKVIITVARNSAKKSLFTASQRVQLISDTVSSYSRVEVDTFDGLIVEYAHSRNAVALVRGLRAVSDFEYEFQMALMNRKIAGQISTVFLMPNERFTYLNSSIIRELARHGADVGDFVPPNVKEALIRHFETSES